ncbi:MAG: hypothetical protein Q3M24_20755 [Candidatus Electrothrix aestuarii]|uniref:Uncharacterized protein n=1 Tax=Candidatus Electrothrix aestuarii TaxID=3062594 RepID=A0AAU8LU30_9BACT|nr:hypothetical protein [Candidatus Electrothrix aestuarii]
MTDPLEQQVRAELKKGRSKKEILKTLATADTKEDVVWYLEQYPTEKKRKKIVWLNWLLVVAVLIVTVKKLYFIALIQLNAVAMDQFSPLLLVELLVPAINFYAITKVIRYFRQGYQFIAVLALLALFRPENRIMPDGALYLLAIALGVYLLLHLFPKRSKQGDAELLAE